MARKADHQGSEDVKKQRGGMRALAVALPRVTEKAVGRRGLAEAGLIADWHSVVGDHIARICLPRRLKFSNRSRRTDGTLILKVESGHALALQHLEPQLIERINAHLGYAAVARLRLQQGPLPGPVDKSRPVDKFGDPQQRLTAEEIQNLERRIGVVEDEDLRQALMNLAKAREEEAKSQASESTSADRF